MNITKEEIAKFDFDRPNLVKRILDSKDNRDLAVDWITNDANIMVYYQCFYLLCDATEKEPEKFIEYWDDFAKLLEHKNSYHRDISLCILANLICCDSCNKFDTIKEKYCSLVYDKKFKTAVSCIHNLTKISLFRKEFIDEIFLLLLNHKSKSVFSDKQEEYIFGTIAEYFYSVYLFLVPEKQNLALDFISQNTKSKSPKTQKICKDILKKINL